MNFKKNIQLVRKLKDDGFIYLKNKPIINKIKQIRKIIKSNFPNKTSYYLNIHHDAFHNMMLNTLDKINQKVDLRAMQKTVEKQYSKTLGIKEKFVVSSFTTFFGTRPHGGNNIKQNSEFVDFHRENFYGKDNYLNYQYNFWFPVFNISKNQNIKYVPKSHLIPNSKIKIKKIKNFVIKKHSAAHQCGMNYAPKKIIQGVDLNKSKRFSVPKDHYLVLNANLIHGNGINLSKKIRYAVAFGLIPKKYID